MEQALIEEDRLLTELERSATQARLALHMAEDCSQNVIACMDTDGDGDCPACLTRLRRGDTDTWRCSRVAEQLRSDAIEALSDALKEALHYAQTLNEKLRTAVDTPS